MLETALSLRRELLSREVCKCRLAEGTRRAVKAWGLNTLVKNPRWYSDSLTVIEVPEVCSLISQADPSSSDCCASLTRPAAAADICMAFTAQQRLSLRS